VRAARYTIAGGIARLATSKFDNQKKIDFFKTIIEFWKKTKLTSLHPTNSIKALKFLQAKGCPPCCPSNSINH